MNRFGFVQAVDGLDQGVVIGASGAADRWVDTGFPVRARFYRSRLARLYGREIQRGDIQHQEETWN